MSLAESLNIEDELPKIYKYILSDHPELYYISPQVSISKSIFSVSGNLLYLYNEKQRQEIDRSFEGLKQALTKELNRSDVEKAYAATFLIMKNSQYEIDNIYNQNAASAIHYHAAQCSGFASAFKYAMDYMGIWCIVVSESVLNGGQVFPHAWNVVKLNENYYHVDITPLAGVSLTDISQLQRYRIFESDAQKKQQGYIWNSSEIPMCSEMNVGNIGKSGAGVHNLLTEKIANENDGGLPTFNRLFDVQSELRECLKNKKNYYEFMLNIPMYSNEKLVRTISSYLAEQGTALSVAYKAEVGCANGRFYLKIKYKN